MLSITIFSYFCTFLISLIHPKVGTYTSSCHVSLPAQGWCFESRVTINFDYRAKKNTIICIVREQRTQSLSLKCWVREMNCNIGNSRIFLLFLIASIDLNDKLASCYISVFEVKLLYQSYSLISLQKLAHFEALC